MRVAALMTRVKHQSRSSGILLVVGCTAAVIHSAEDKGEAAKCHRQEIHKTSLIRLIAGRNREPRQLKNTA